MKALVSIFKIRFKCGIQYRIPAFAGVCTQFFWGFMLLMIYAAFYENSSAGQPIEYEQLVAYIWLQQAFLHLIALWAWSYDKDIQSMIETGGIAYELVRPKNLYLLWMSKMFAARIAGVLLRCFPIIIVGFFLPHPYNLPLPDSIPALIMFFASLFVGMFISIGFLLLLYMTGFFTVTSTNIVNISTMAVGFLNGQLVPVALMPDAYQKFVYCLPFPYINDFPFRIYCGNIPMTEALSGFIIEILWAAVLVLLGLFVMHKGQKRVVSQGG